LKTTEAALLEVETIATPKTFSGENSKSQKMLRAGENSKSQKMLRAGFGLCHFLQTKQQK